MLYMNILHLTSCIFSYAWQTSTYNCVQCKQELRLTRLEDVVVSARAIHYQDNNRPSIGKLNVSPREQYKYDILWIFIKPSPNVYQIAEKKSLQTCVDETVEWGILIWYNLFICCAPLPPIGAHRSPCTGSLILLPSHMPSFN